MTLCQSADDDAIRPCLTRTINSSDELVAAMMSWLVKNTPSIYETVCLDYYHFYIVMYMHTSVYVLYKSTTDTDHIDSVEQLAA